MTPEIKTSYRTVEIPGHTNHILSNIGYSSAFLHNIHHRSRVDFCTILSEKILTSSADEVTAKPTPRFWKIVIYAKYPKINSTLS